MEQQIREVLGKMEKEKIQVLNNLYHTDKRIGNYIYNMEDLNFVFSHMTLLDFLLKYQFEFEAADEYFYIDDRKNIASADNPIYLIDDLSDLVNWIADTLGLDKSIEELIDDLIIEEIMGRE
ncbi:MAG: hypothetical protein GX857_04205 [Bacteroidales bacterium]|nr:hypothetical protein [Bacteroidales bacterium]